MSPLIFFVNEWIYYPTQRITDVFIKKNGNVTYTYKRIWSADIIQDGYLFGISETFKKKLSTYRRIVQTHVLGDEQDNKIQLFQCEVFAMNIVNFIEILQYYEE